jgi:hypothetical protein
MVGGSNTSKVCGGAGSFLSKGLFGKFADLSRRIGPHHGLLWLSQDTYYPKIQDK